MMPLTSLRSIPEKFKNLKYKFILVIGAVLTISFGVLLSYMGELQNNLIIGQARHQARMLHHQLILTRQWVSDHQGLFVVKTDRNKENPYLNDPNVKTEDGITLVKRNPAMVTRELSGYAQEEGYGWFRVTSLKPVNPANKPDAFEQASLELFARENIPEHIEIESTANKKTLRYIAPLLVKESCMSCHSVHGYNIGDIRGALSISIPIEWADTVIEKNIQKIFFLGILSVILVSTIMYVLFNVLVTTRLSKLEQAMDSYPDIADPVSLLPEGEDEIGRLSSKFSALCKRLEHSSQRLDQAHEQAFYNEKMAALGQITAGISHEINNPLGGLLNCVKNMRDDPHDIDMQTRYLPLLDKGLRQIESIMRQLLNFGRNEPLQLRKIIVDDEIRECIALLEYRMKDIDVALDLSVEQSYCIDAEAFKQIIVNIGLNAIQAMPDGGRLTVTSLCNADVLKIIFTDTGIGIDPEIQDKIFDPFFTTKDIGQGTGLGLAVTYSLVQKMGGEISVNSHPGEGAVFTVTLPASDHCKAPDE